MIKGDIDSFKYFFDSYYSDLYNFVHINLGDQILAVEIVQDIRLFLRKTWKTLKSTLR
jgi:hypothetical protein